MSWLRNVFDCDAPVALVTGSGAPRVGREIARHLATLGCRLALHANASIEQAEAAAEAFRDEFKIDAIVTQGSLEDADTPERIVRQTYHHFGRLDILVNSAGIWQPQPLAEITAADLRRYFDVNAVATFLCARAAGMLMADQPTGGSIVNLGDWGTIRPYLDHAAYFPSKAAVEVMTRSLAVEFAQLNPRIRVNCIQPGPVLLANDVSAEQRQQIASTTLGGRIGKPQHVAHAVQFLSENEFITGVCLPVDGGRSVFAADGLQVGLNTG